jgi:1-acyl-sn-glycerol-3-phosphate acyltransferase
MSGRVGGVLRLVAAVVVTVGNAVLVILLIPFDRKGRLYHWVARLWSRMLLRICGVRVTLLGTEHLVPGQSYIYASNHASMFDIPVVAGTLPDDIRMVYKKELEKIPLFGWGLKWGSYIAVDRSRSQDALRSLEEAAAKIRNGASVLLFVEGTRSQDGALQPFKRGAFALAVRAGVPVIPLTINGSYHIVPKHSLHIRPGPVELVLDSPIVLEKVEGRDAERVLQERVRASIERHYRAQ